MKIIRRQEGVFEGVEKQSIDFKPFENDTKFLNNKNIHLFQHPQLPASFSLANKKLGTSVEYEKLAHFLQLTDCISFNSYRRK